jgi:hypothetical protein
VKALETEIEKRLQDDYKKRLKLTTLPDSLKKGIKSAAKTAAERATSRNLEVEAMKVSREFYQPAAVDKLISAKLTQAKAGVKVVSQSADLAEILKENAKLLRKKWQALVDAGFTKDQAYELIKAEIVGKAARRSS